MSPRNKGIVQSAGRFVVGIVLVLVALALPALAEPPEQLGNAEHSCSPVSALQGFVSKADGPRCPMVPTCSQYAAQAFRQHNLLVGWMLTCDRLLRCGRDETRRAPIVRTPDGSCVQDPLSAKLFWWKKSR